MGSTATYIAKSSPGARLQQAHDSHFAHGLGNEALTA